MTIKHYIWDFDGTLFDTYPAMLVALEQANERHAINYTGDLEAFIKAKSIRAFANQYAPDPLAFLKDYHELEEQTQTHPQPYPGIADLLAQLSQAGADHYILSHRDEKTWDYLGELRPFFKGGVTSNMGLKRKPDPEGIHYILTTYGLAAESTMMVGDRPLDIQAGIQAKVKTLLFDPNCQFQQLADYHITQWGEFPNDN